MYKKYLEKTSLKRLFFIMFLWFFIVPVADKSINVMANYVFKEQGYIYSKLVAGLDKSYANYNVEDVSKELHMLLSEEFDNNKELSSIVDKEKLLNQDFNKNIDVLSALL